MRKRAEGGARTAPGMTVLSTRHRVLIVDDDPACRALLDAMLTTNGYHVSATDSVLGATELLASFQPNVILLDLALPYRSGASWLSQLKADPNTAQIPVVILSAVPDMLPRARRELAQAIVRKPFRSQELLDIVQIACTSSEVSDGRPTFDSASSQPPGSP